MNKRQAVAALTTEQIQLIAEAAQAGATIKNFSAADQRKVRAAVKVLRKVRGAQ